MIKMRIHRNKKTGKIIVTEGKNNYSGEVIITANSIEGLIQKLTEKFL